MIKQEHYDTRSRQFPPGINGPLKVRSIFSHFLLLEFSLPLFFRNHKKIVFAQLHTDHGRGSANKGRMSPLLKTQQKTSVDSSK